MKRCITCGKENSFMQKSYKKVHLECFECTVERSFAPKEEKTYNPSAQYYNKPQLTITRKRVR